MPTRVVRFREWYARQPAAVKVAVAVGGGAAGVIAGVCAAPGIGAAMSAAGLGVAGGTLSGAAASSAGLAALGGGAVTAGGLGVAGGTALVAALAGATGAASATCASRQITKEGVRTAGWAREAEAREVAPGGIRFEEGEA